jgi:Niemann-Pick C1 protein
MWFSLIIAGALHGLVLLPVILSLAGGPGFPMQEADEEWMATAIRSGYEYTSVGSNFLPFPIIPPLN